MIHSAKFSLEERRWIAQLNQVRSKADQAEFCARSCLFGSLGLTQLKNGAYELKSEETAETFSEAEVKCADNCAYKMFSSEKVMRAYLPTRMAGLKLT